jgi:hypothetical protein
MMKLEIKHFKTEQYVDITDEFGNVLRRMHYRDPQIDLLTSCSARTWAQAYVEGWNAAKHAVPHALADDRMIDVERQNESLRSHKILR